MTRWFIGRGNATAYISGEDEDIQTTPEDFREVSQEDYDQAVAATRAVAEETRSALRAAAAERREVSLQDKLGRLVSAGIPPEAAKILLDIEA